MIVRSAAGMLMVATSGLAVAQGLPPAPAVGDIIVVTGEKVIRTIQDTPASVAVTTSATIVDQDLKSVYDILDRTPNLAVNGSRTSFSIRGIDAFDVSGGGDGALASVYLDGAVLPRFALTAGPLDLYDIEQVEVYRGPQSTVQGRNALAGAVIIRTADPTYDWTGRARVLITDKSDERRLGAALGGPIVDGQIAFRIAGEVSRANGVVYNGTLNTDGDSRRSETVRGKLLFTPEALPGLRIVATYMHDRHRRGTPNVELDPPYDPRDRTETSDVLDVQRVKTDIGTLQIGYDLGDRTTVTAITNDSHVRYAATADADRTAVPGQVSQLASPDKTFQQELRLNFDRGWVQGLVGGYYLRDDNRGYFFQATQNLSLTQLGADRQLLAAGLPQSTVNTVLSLYGGFVPIRNTLAQPQLIHNEAAFTDLTFPVSDRLRLHAGLRYDHESQLRGATQSVMITRPLPDPTMLPIPALAPIVAQLNALITATATAANSIDPARIVTYHAWLPKAGITYDIARDVSLSATAQRGYRAGGSGLNQQRAQAYDFDPEYTWNYELALRSEWLDHRLTVNANAYWIDWRDQQVSVQLTPGSIYDTQTINAGKSRLYGFELEVSGRPTPALNLYAGVGNSHTRFRRFDISIGQLLGAATGNEFAEAPHWTLSGGATWRDPRGPFVNVNANYRSAFYQDAQVQTVRDVRARTLVNAKIGWQGDHLGAFLVASNIFNVQKPTSDFLDIDGRHRGAVTDPRILGLSLEGRF